MTGSPSARNLLARGLEDVEYFVALDKLLTDKLAGGRACDSSSAGGGGHAAACCSLATEAASALDATGEVASGLGRMFAVHYRSSTLYQIC